MIFATFASRAKTAITTAPLVLFTVGVTQKIRNKMYRYMTIKEASEKWGIVPQSDQYPLQ